MCGNKAGLEVSFLERQQWSMSSLHTCSLLPSHCSLALDYCQTPLPWFSRQGKRDSAPAQLLEQGKLQGAAPQVHSTT